MRRLSSFVSAFAFAVAAFSVPVFAQSEVTNQTLDDCKLIPDDAARLACFDRVMKAGRGDIAGTGGQTSPVPVPQMTNAGGGGAGGGGAGGAGTPVAGGGQVSPPMTAEERREAEKKAFGLPVYAKPGAKDRKREEIKEVTGKVASIGVTGPNRLRITTGDGEVWDQVEGDPRVAKVGDDFTVKAGVMGSLLCKVGSAQSYRCVRADRPGQS